MNCFKRIQVSVIMFVILVFTLAIPAQAAQLGLEWATYYGTDSNYQDAAEAVTVAPDGTIVTVGFALSLFSEAPWFRVDAFIAQFSADGTALLNEMILEGCPINGAFGVGVESGQDRG